MREEGECRSLLLHARGHINFPLNSPLFHLHSSTMETLDRDRIYQWLAQVPEDTAPVQTDGELQVDAVNALTTQPAARAPEPRDLEIDLMQNQLANCDQGSERRHSQARALQTPNHTMPTPPNPYERRPRQKTRKDRYEYKASGAVTRDASKCHKDKKKRPMRGRKQTINDEFHASNVARDRLTLRDSKNLGIFSKGKASSPIKMRGAEALAFSEAEFLSHKNHLSSRPTPTSKWTEKTGQGKKRQRTLLEYSPPELPKDMGPKPSELQRDPKRRRIEAEVPQFTTQRASSSVKVSLHDAPKASEDIPETSHQEISDPKEIQEESQPATPYTWCETIPSPSQQDRELEAHLLTLLRAGLFSRRNTDHSEKCKSRRSYCDIADLRKCLHERKAYWSSGTIGTCRSRVRSQCLGSRRESREKTRSSIKMRTVSPAAHINKRRHSMKSTKSVADCCSRKPSGGCRHEYRARETREFRSRSGCHPRERTTMDLKHIELEDDKSFFKRLDEAYHAIVQPEDEEQWDDGDQLEIFETHKQAFPSLQPRQLPAGVTKNQLSLHDSVDKVLLNPPEHRGVPESGLPALQDSWTTRPTGTGSVCDDGGPHNVAFETGLSVPDSGMALLAHQEQPPRGNSTLHIHPNTAPMGFWWRKNLY